MLAFFIFPIYSIFVTVVAIIIISSLTIIFFIYRACIFASILFILALWATIVVNVLYK